MTLKVLFMGQSNAIGRFAEGVTTPGSGVTVWNCDSDRNDLVNLGNAFVTPNVNSSPFESGYNSPALWFANRLAKMTGQSVELVLVARGGTAIAEWCTTGGARGDMYARMQAVVALTGITKFDVFAWHQGESDDTGALAAVYASCFNGMLTNLTSDGYISSTTPVIIGTVAPPQGTYINPVLRGMPSGRLHLADISHVENDGTHFYGRMAPSIGLYYAMALAEDANFVASWPMLDSNSDVGQHVIRGAGSAGVTFPSGASELIPLRGVAGVKSAVNAAGRIVVDRTGLWQFGGKGITRGDQQWLKILDATGAILTDFGYSGTGASGSTPVTAGLTTMLLCAGDEVGLGASQNALSSSAISENDAGKWCELTASWVGKK